MKILPLRVPRAAPAASQAPQSAQHEDTTTEFEAGAELRAHRRTTVTVERETISIFVRQPVAGAAVADSAQLAKTGDLPEPPDRNLPASPAARNALSGGNP